ncbi:MAG: TylF/MycF/NovP-related O-methyltransferase [Verrucomicrobiaceae bacterium]|jgi:hypothetical protein
MDPSRFRSSTRNTTQEVSYRSRVESYFANSPGTICERLEAFPKFVSRQSVARHLALYEVFKLVMDVHGEIIEGGVNWGGGLMWFAQMSASLEPVNLNRRITGFDTFEGFPSLSEHDGSESQEAPESKEGGFSAPAFEDIKECISLFDQNRFIGHVPKVRVIKGNACVTMPQYLKDHPYCVVSLLHLDFDIYEPTKAAIETFLPRMPKGAVILFDELNNSVWPGETLAVLDSLGLSNLRIRRFPFEPHISYAVIE